MSSPTDAVLAEVAAERAAQDALFGVQDLPDMAGSPENQRNARKFFKGCADRYKAINDGVFDPRDDDPRLDYTGVFLEEVYEALAESDPAKIRAELVQAVAVGVKWIEAIDRRSTDG
ncbi:MULTISPECIES: hypothetical protein [unclassified Streptomyces]|uniref:hypothetical protein n=1 Tax=unclassified Streptomyces TaxID=2593676 RepID=UPI0033E28B04